MPRCPTSKRPGAFNAHNPGDGGSGLVQPVFRSPARTPSAESTRKGLCTAPPSEKRYTLSRIKPRIAMSVGYGEGFRMPARVDLSARAEGRRPKASQEGTRGGRATACRLWDVTGRRLG